MSVGCLADNRPMPSIGDYVDALAHPEGRFRTLEGVEAMTDPRGEIRFCAGNNAAVFPVTANNKSLMLKCYIKSPFNSEAIYGFVSATSDPLLTGARLLKNEIYVFDPLGDGSYRDVVVSDRIEGITLDTAIRRAVREEGAAGLGRLSAAFDNLAAGLLSREWAHGDLKPENIIVELSGRLRLVDYDAMFIPELEGKSTAEVGTLPYQHPFRDENLYDGSLDDYSIAIISVSLRALTLNPSLYWCYNGGDNIIMYPHEILSGKSRGYQQALELFYSHGDHASLRLAEFLLSPTPRIGGLSSMLGTR